MNKKEILKKIAGCKALQGKKVADVIAMPEFTESLAAYWKAQVEDWKAMRASFNAARKLGGARGMKVPAHPLDKLVDWPLERIVAEYGAIFEGSSTLPAQQRDYIEQLGTQAYNYTVGKIVIKEFPETEEFFFPKTNKS